MKTLRQITISQADDSRFDCEVLGSNGKRYKHPATLTNPTEALEWATRIGSMIILVTEARDWAARAKLTYFQVEKQEAALEELVVEE